MGERTGDEPGDAYVGKGLGSHEFVATDKLLSNYFNGLDLDRSWYSEQSPFETPVTPSMILTAADSDFNGGGFNNSFGTLWIRQEWDLRAPIMPGERCHVASKVLDIYEHRGRTVVSQQVDVTAPDGAIMARGKHHQSYLLTQTSGRVALRDPRSKEGVRRFKVPEGEAINSVTRRIDLEMCGRFFHGNASYHTDKGAAEALGFDDVVVGGRMTMSYIGDLLDRRFGKGWYEGGTLDIKFTNIVWPEDVVVAKGMITGRTEENGKGRATVTVWMEKDDGTVVIVGSASALE